MNSAHVLALILLASVSLGVAALPLTPEEAAGKRLYREGLSASGEAIMARVGAADMLLPATSLPCANCHGADGPGIGQRTGPAAGTGWRAADRHVVVARSCAGQSTNFRAVAGLA